MPNALVHAIREVSWELAYFWEHDLKDFGKQVWHSAILPVLVVMITLLTVLQSIIWLRQQHFYRRRIAQENPTRAASLCHIQALSTTYPRIAYYKTPRKQQAAFKETVQLLQQAIAFDPNYIPPYLSWAALYLYTPNYRDAAMALHILQQLQQQATMESTNRSNKKNAAAAAATTATSDASSSNKNMQQALELDAKALLAGQPEHMFQDILRRDEFLSPAFASSSATALFASVGGNNNRKKLQ